MNDPTTLAASILKIQNKVHIPEAVKAKALQSQDFLNEKSSSATKPSSETSSSSSSSSSSSRPSCSYKQPSLFDIPDAVPKLKLTDLLTPTRMVVDGDRDNIWARSTDREGEELVLNPGLARVISFR